MELDELEEVRALLARGQRVGVLTHAEIRGTASQLDLDDSDVEELHGVIERLAIELVEEIDPATTAGNEVQRAPDRRARRAPSARPNANSDMPTDSLGVFLKQIGRVRLLTAPEEITLAKRIERGDLRAKQRMVVQPAARRLDRQELSPQRPGVPGSDPGRHARSGPRGREVRLPARLQVLDVCDVVDSPGDRARARRQGAHDTSTGSHRRQAQQDQPGAAHVPRRARPRTHAKETAKLVGLPRDQVESIKRMSQQPLSLEKPVGDEDGAVLGQFLADEHAESPYARAVDILNTQALSEALGSLSDRARRMLELRYGLGGECPCTLAEVGRTFNVTRERIRQIENDSLRKLKALPGTQQLRDAI